MTDTMNLMQFVYSDKDAQRTADLINEPYRNLMHYIMHDFMCIKDDRFAPIRFRVVNGEPYAEWVEHTADEWKELLSEIGRNHLKKMIEADLNDIVDMLFRGNDDDKPNS